jgi:enoyl-CoA hydratase/carnithine racemase
MGQQRAYELGMVSRVVPRGDLAETTFALADRIAAMPPFGLALAKRAVNQCEDQMGLRPGMDARVNRRALRPPAPSSSCCPARPTRSRGRAH